MLEAIFWGACLRIIQAAFQAAPFIFTGLCVTGLLHRLMGQRHTRWLFGSNSIASLLQAWVIGLLLPGCSLGVIPIVRQLRRSGIAAGTILAFALSSPLFDPLSILYGLTLSKPFTIVAFAFCSLIVVTISGSLFDRMFPQTEPESAEQPATPHGIKRLLAVVVVMARESVSATVGYIAIGLAGVGLLSTMLPPGSLQRTMGHDNLWSPVLMTAVAIPAYATPMTAMGQLGSMFQHGNSIGAAFILLVFGAGLNLGLLVWMVANYGTKKSLVWMGLMLGIVVGVSYGIERPLYPHEIEAADHTHAFDSYCQPFSGSAPMGGFLAEIWRRLRMETQLHEVVGASLLLVLFILGGLLKWLDRYWVVETWLNRPVPRSPLPATRTWDIVVPGPILAGAGLLSIIAFSIVGCYAYYPTPNETLDELSLANTEALGAALSGHREHALHWIPVCESWNRRLQVGTYLRRWHLSDYHRMKAQVFRDRMEDLEHMVENREADDAIRRQIVRTSIAFQRMAAAFRDELD